MKENIYTIPVTDGFNQKSECPFCNMYNKLDNDAVEYMLGPSYMEDDIREETDKIGFCKEHYHKMYTKQNRLGLALMAQTHIHKINSVIKKYSCEYIKNRPEPGLISSTKGIFSKKNNSAEKIPEFLNNITNSCYICNKINTTFERYINTFFYLWKKDNSIKEIVKNCGGFCIQHYSMLLTEGFKELKTKEFNNFFDIISEVEINNIKRIEDEIDLFINKFDYRYKDVPWGTSKDALERTITKLSSQFMEEEDD